MKSRRRKGSMTWAGRSTCPADVELVGARREVVSAFETGKSAYPGHGIYCRQVRADRTIRKDT